MINNSALQKKCRDFKAFVFPCLKTPALEQFAGGDQGSLWGAAFAPGSWSVTTKARVMDTSCWLLWMMARVLMTKATSGPGIQACSIPDEVHRDFTESDKIISQMIIFLHLKITCSQFWSRTGTWRRVLERNLVVQDMSLYQRGRSGQCWETTGALSFSRIFFCLFYPCICLDKIVLMGVLGIPWFIWLEHLNLSIQIVFTLNLLKLGLSSRYRHCSYSI